MSVADVLYEAGGWALELVAEFLGPEPGTDEREEPARKGDAPHLPLAEAGYVERGVPLDGRRQEARR